MALINPYSLLRCCIIPPTFQQENQAKRKEEQKRQDLSKTLVENHSLALNFFRHQEGEKHCLNSQHLRYVAGCHHCPQPAGGEVLQFEGPTAESGLVLSIKVLYCASLNCISVLAGTSATSVPKVTSLTLTQWFKSHHKERCSNKPLVNRCSKDIVHCCSAAKPVRKRRGRVCLMICNKK